MNRLCIHLGAGGGGDHSPIALPIIGAAHVGVVPLNNLMARACLDIYASAPLGGHLLPSLASLRPI